MMIQILYIVLLALNIADIESTRCALAEGHGELNPIVDWLIKEFGISAVYIAKFSVLGLLAFSLDRMKWSTKEVTWVKGALLAAVIFYSMVLFYNATLITLS